MNGGGIASPKTLSVAVFRLELQPYSRSGLAGWF
jgi:hypothetical protein